MARSQSTIEASMKDKINQIDPSTDTTKGPVPDLFVTPVAGVSSEQEAEVEHLDKLVSYQFDDVATDEESEAMARSHGIGVDTGKAATANQRFLKYSRPRTGESIQVGLGEIVSTEDMKLQYRVILASDILTSDNADYYYDATVRAYVIIAKIQALGSGTEYNVPKYRITRMVTIVDGIDATQNWEILDDGKDKTTASGVLGRTQTKITGISTGSSGGLESEILEYDTTYIKGVSLVYPSDYSIFFRNVGRPAIDAYVIGERLNINTYAYTYTGGDPISPPTYIDVILDKQPMISIISVKRNGADTSEYTFIPDESLAYKNSARASDKIRVAVYSNNDVIEVQYYYNRLISDMQTDLFSKKRLFDTDILARTPNFVGLSVVVTGASLSRDDVDNKIEEVKSYLLTACNPEVFTSYLIPDTLRTGILSEVGGLSSLYFTVFTSIENSLLEVEVVEFDKTQLPQLLEANLEVNIT